MEIVLIESYTDKPWRSPETYHIIKESLSERWDVTAVKTKDPKALHRTLKERQREARDIFVFNLAEYLDEENKEGFLPALLDAWDIPHLGSSAAAVANGLDKARTKELLDEQQVPTPSYFIAHRETDYIASAEEIGYPLIVKPLMEGGHIGISDDSVVHDADALETAVEHIWEVHDQPALVEAYITGADLREFSVGIIDEESPLFTPIEIDYDAMDVKEKILTYEAAQRDLERIKPVNDASTRDKIIELSCRTFNAVGAKDYSRIDLRMNRDACYVLEINVMPGLGPHSFLPEAAEDLHGLKYPQLIQKLVENSISRQGLDEA